MKLIIELVLLIIIAVVIKHVLYNHSLTRTCETTAALTICNYKIDKYGD